MKNGGLRAAVSFVVDKNLNCSTTPASMLEKAAQDR